MKRERAQRRYNLNPILAGFGLGFALGIIGGWALAVLQ